jgi:uncharacterized protein (TIRG00374 family)
MALSDRDRRWLKFAVALGFSLAFSYLFIRGLDAGEVRDALAEADYVYVVPALLLFAASLIVRSLRWHYFLLPSPDLGWQKLLPSLLVGYAGNNLLPLRAGELLRAQHLAVHQQVARMQTFGTLLMERLFDGIVLAIFVLWGLLLVDVGTAYLGVGLALAGLSLAGFAGCLLVANKPRLAERITHLPVPFLGSRLREQFAGLSQSFLSGWAVLRSPARFLMAAVTSAGAWSLELAMYWLISRAFGLEVSFITVAFAGAAANVAMSLPSAQGGVGPFQYFAQQALLKFSVPAGPAAAYALALHIFLVVPVSLAGLFVLWRLALPGRVRTKASAATPLEAADQDLAVP